MKANKMSKVIIFTLLFVLSLNLFSEHIYSAGFISQTTNQNTKCPNFNTQGQKYNLVYNSVSGDLLNKKDFTNKVIEDIDLLMKDTDTKIVVNYKVNKETLDWIINQRQNFRGIESPENPLITNLFKVEVKSMLDIGNGLYEAKIEIATTQPFAWDNQNNIPNKASVMKLGVVAKNVASNLAGLSDIEKLDRIDCWLSQNFKYDYSKNNFRAVHAIENGGLTVCNGFVEMYKLICDEADLSNKVKWVNGKYYEDNYNGYHAWIEYQGDDGKVYIVDPTSNLSCSGANSTKKNFLVPKSTGKYRDELVYRPTYN